MSVFPIPLGRDVIIHPIEREAKVGRIYLTDKSRLDKRTNQGIIVAKGPLVSDDIDTADHVFFNGYTGDQITFEDGGQFFVVPEEFLICKIEHSSVVLMSTETVKRIIQERFGELHSQGVDNHSLTELEQSLLDRIESITIAEGFEF